MTSTCALTVRLEREQLELRIHLQRGDWSVAARFNRIHSLLATLNGTTDLTRDDPDAPPVM